MKDFSILLEKISTPSAKKDLTIVSGFNAISQYIEFIFKTQRGELSSNANIGSNYFDYIYNGQGNFSALQTSLAGYIKAAMPFLSNVYVVTTYADTNVFQFTVTYSLSNGIRMQENVATYIEVNIS